MTEINWPRTIRDACWLKLWLDQREGDEVARAEGRTIVTAVDASVAILYGEPRLKRDDVQLLGTLNPTTLDDLAFSLGHLTLHKSTHGNDRMILLPGHDEEFLTVFSVIHRRHGDAFRALVPQLADEYRRVVVPAILTGANAGTADARQTARYIGGQFRLIDGILANPEFDFVRWFDFIRRANFAGVEEIGLHADPSLVQDLRGQWFELIRAEKANLNSAVRIDRDAEAIATMAAMNIAEQSAGSSRRVVLTTLDVALQAAALRNPHVPGADALRDARQYVGLLPSSVGAFVHDRGRPEQRHYGVREWLSVFLSPLVDEGDDQRALVHLALLPESHPDWNVIASRFTGKVERRSRGFTSSFRGEWDTFIRLGINRYGAEHLTQDPRLGMISRVIQEEAELHTALTDYVVGVLSDASVMSIVAGLYLTSAQTKSDWSKHRMPVAILSPDLEQGAEFLRSVEAVVAGGRIPALGADLGSLDFRGKYVKHLTYGCFFAAIGNWEATETLAMAAIAFVDGQDAATRAPQPNGDEAAYLLAVARRHRARSPADLALASQALEDFERRRAASGLEGTDPRTVVERVAIQLNNAFAARLLRRPWPELRPLDAAAALEALADAEAALERYGDVIFRRLVRKQIYVVEVGVGVLGEIAAGSVGDVGRRALENGSAKLRRLIEVEYGTSFFERASKSRYVSILLAFAGARLGRRDDAPRVLGLLAEAIAEPEMAFDREMYQAMRGLLIAA